MTEFGGTLTRMHHELPMDTPRALSHDCQSRYYSFVHVGVAIYSSLLLG